MNCYPTGELGMGALLKRALRLHYLSLRYSILCILLITITKFIATSMPTVFSNGYIAFATYLLCTLLISFFFSAALLATHRAFIDQPKPIKNAIQTIWVEKKRIYAILAAYAAGIVCLHYLTLGILFLEERLFPSIAVHGFTLMLLTALLLTFVAMFFFAPFYVVIEKTSFGSVVRSSLILGEKNKFGIFLLFILLFVLTLLLAPKSMHEYYLSTYHLDVLYDFIALCVLLPIFINFTLLLINDSKQQVPVGELTES